MIWLLLNLWWLFPAAIALTALVALISGLGGPALLAIARRVPAPAYAVLVAAVALSLGSSWLVGVGEARCQAAQEAAEKRADAKGERVAKRAQGAAQKARDTIRKESDDAQAEVRTIVRTLPATCPDQPDRLRELGRAAVESAGREVLPAEGR